MTHTLCIRTAQSTDHSSIVQAIQQWWGDSRTPEQARQLSSQLPRLFLKHFSSSSLIAYDDTGMRGFLIGFLSADHPHQAYIHFVGVDPSSRKQGVARTLYTTFFNTCTAAKVTEVHAITSPANTGSIAFHTAMGFVIEPSDTGEQVHRDYDGPEKDRVLFCRYLP